jgi:hypothetical protein
VRRTVSWSLGWGWDLIWEWVQTAAWRYHRAWQESSGLVSAGDGGSGQDQQGSYNRRQVEGDVALHGGQRGWAASSDGSGVVEDGMLG